MNKDSVVSIEVTEMNCNCLILLLVSIGATVSQPGVNYVKVAKEIFTNFLMDLFILLIPGIPSTILFFKTKSMLKHQECSHSKVWI